MIGRRWGFVACLIVAVQASFPLPSDFTTWGWLSSVVVGDYLYIDGGEWNTHNEDISNRPSKNGFSTLNTTLAIDLSKSWTNASVSAISSKRDAQMKTSRRPLLWYNADNPHVYEWGGWTYDGNDKSNEKWIWTFQPDGSGNAIWSQNLAPSVDGQPLNTSFGSSAAYTTTNFYSLGGTYVPPATTDHWHTPNVTMQGLLGFDFSSNMWTNESSVHFARSGFSVLGEACFVPNFGKQGLLMFLGGDSPFNDTYQYTAANTLVDMSIIPMYDISTGNWYHQTATGDVPSGRTGLCAIGAPAADDSSFEIFIYGGFSNTSVEILDSAKADFEDVFVLSLPAFRWFRAANGTRRAYHTCQLVGGRQMLSIGGFPLDKTNKPTSVPESTDPWTNGIGIFDMTEMNWSSSYDASALPYEQSMPVKQYYSSNPEPPTWNDPALAGVFAKSSSNSTNKSSSSEHHGTNTGAIVGGVIGGLAGICAILALALFFLRRKRRQSRDKRQPSSNAAEETTKYHPVHEMPAEPKYNELGPTPDHELGTDPAPAGELEAAPLSPIKELDASDIAGGKREKQS